MFRKLLIGLVASLTVACAAEPAIEGNAGVNGQDGNPGEVGAPGNNGAPGTNGINGSPGLPGADGVNGNSGNVGAQGPQGIPGIAGGGLDLDSGGRFKAGMDAVAGPGYYAIAIGKESKATGAGAAAIGEVLLSSGDNSSTLGYASQATGHFSAAIGCYNTASGLGSIAIGMQSVASRPGEMAHSSGAGANSGFHGIDLYRNALTGSASLTDRMGGSFNFKSVQLNSMRVRAMAATKSQTKVAAEVHELLVSCSITTCSILNDTVLAGGVSFASKGWSFNIAPATGTEIRFTVNSGTDTVNTFARVEWTDMGNL